MIDGEKLLDKILTGYDLCDNDTRYYINQMMDIYNDKESNVNEKKLAFNTIIDALGPFLNKEEIDLLLI